MNLRENGGFAEGEAAAYILNWFELKIVESQQKRDWWT